MDLQEQVEEVAQMWDDGEYDNFKDVIQDCWGLQRDLKKTPDADLSEIVERVLMEATTAAQEMVDDDPEMAAYMEGLIDPSYLSAEYQAKRGS